MTATTLDKIDKAYQELTAGQLDGKLIPKGKYDSLVHESTRNLGGHQVLDKEELSRRAVAHVNEIVAYANSRAKFITELKAIGIMPLATLPVDAWNKICKETKLLQFRPNNGKVYFNDEECRKEHDNTVQTITGFSIAGIILTILAVSLGTSLYTHDGAGPVFYGLVARAFVPLCFYGIVECSTWCTYRFWTKAIVKRKLRSYEGISKYVVNSSLGTATQLRLPAPPAEVQETMLKIHKDSIHNIHVAAVADAVSFVPDLNDIYAKNADKALKDEWAERARLRAEAATRDPINYLVRDGVVAIIAQYGEFPVEQKLIDRLVKEEVVEMPY